MARGRGIDLASGVIVLNRIFVVLTMLLAGTATLRAQGFQTAAPYAFLMDYDTGAILFEKAADDLMVPASLAKLMTAEVVFQEITQGRLSLDTEMAVSENAWRKGGGPSGGSAMFVNVHSRVKVSDLLRGLIVQSGNDAAIVLAEGISGNEPTFAGKMTARARELGLTKSVFMNATGMPDPLQRVTAREMALLAVHLITAYPDLYKIFGERDFIWNKIRQSNRNPLLAMEIGADGLKTGNVDEAGYGLVGSAVQNGQRLIVVVNGLKSARDRAQEGRKILEWGFRSFEPRTLFGAGESVGKASMFGGDRGSVDLVARQPVRILVPRGVQEKLAARIVYRGPLRAPLSAGTEVARLQVSRGDVKALDIPLYAQEDVPVGSLIDRAWDASLELASNLIRKGFAKVAEIRR